VSRSRPGDRRRAAKYRHEADKLYVEAAGARDAHVRDFLMQIAVAYNGLATHLEVRAAEVCDTAQANPCKSILAPTDPTAVH
jgi:hypothetical protein